MRAVSLQKLFVTREPTRQRILAKIDAACGGFWMPGSSPGMTVLG